MPCHWGNTSSLIVVWRTILTILDFEAAYQHMDKQQADASWHSFIVVEAWNAGRFKHKTHLRPTNTFLRIHLKGRAAIWTSAQVAHTRLGWRHVKRMLKHVETLSPLNPGSPRRPLFCLCFRNTLAVCPLWRFRRARYRSFFAPAMSGISRNSTHKQNGIDNINMKLVMQWCETLGPLWYLWSERRSHLLVHFAPSKSQIQVKIWS